MADFWKSAGGHLVERTENGWLEVSDDYLRAYYTRPEIHPVETSCAMEHALFERLMEEPRAEVDPDEIAAIVDADAADNYRFILGFRDFLLRHGTIEGAYRALFRDDAPPLPAMILDQMVHLIAKNILRGATDPIRVRAAELLFREQSVSTEDGRLMLADTEILEMHAQTGGLGGLGALLVETGTPMREVALDVLDEDNKSIYWARSDRFDTAIDFRFTQPALDAFARVLEAWIRHFHAVEVRIQPQQSIRDERWSWHAGLDAQASRILNALYEQKPTVPGDLDRIVALFRLEFEDGGTVIETMRGKPVWLGMAMTADNRVKVKPQNLLTNLPLKRAE
ncbi:hypothetical protein C8N35_10330 [Breoghania corrubedonensis]|uniref:Uncharacterized protein n=1 Tax=Breoghania corrubedonensis TaxID=665038 RepID=A0A2T5VAT4_9HYPH|nr:DUF6352 family protein [Breoghania corrubedonensis]PTW60851.1 hypothetical protein C8N35_10330 [Breoghania corrubedonensis]